MSLTLFLIVQQASLDSLSLHTHLVPSPKHSQYLQALGVQLVVVSYDPVMACVATTMALFVPAALAVMVPVLPLPLYLAWSYAILELHHFQRGGTMVALLGVLACAGSTTVFSLLLYWAMDRLLYGLIGKTRCFEAIFAAYPLIFATSQFVTVGGALLRSRHWLHTPHAVNLILLILLPAAAAFLGLFWLRLRSKRIAFEKYPPVLGEYLQSNSSSPVSQVTSDPAHNILETDVELGPPRRLTESPEADVNLQVMRAEELLVLPLLAQQLVWLFGTFVEDNVFEMVAFLSLPHEPSWALFWLFLLAFVAGAVKGPGELLAETITQRWLRLTPLQAVCIVHVTLLLDVVARAISVPSSIQLNTVCATLALTLTDSLRMWRPNWRDRSFLSTLALSLMFAVSAAASSIMLHIWRIL